MDYKILGTFADEKIQEILDLGIEEFGNVLIKNFPIETELKQTVQRFCDFCVYFGEPVPQGIDGSVIGFLGPGSVEWRAEQPFHVDGSRYLGLLCVNKAWRGGYTRIIPSLSILSELENRWPKELRELENEWPFWRKGRPGPPVFFRKIIDRSSSDFRLFYLPNTLRAVEANTDIRFTSNQNRAIQLLDDIIENTEEIYELMLDRGDLLVIDNYRFLHARSAYEDDPTGGAERLLLRSWMEKKPAHLEFSSDPSANQL